MRYLLGLALLGMVLSGGVNKVWAAEDGGAEELWRPGGGAGGGVNATEFSAKAVEQAIQRAKTYLIRSRGGDGSWASNHNGKYPTGTTALAAYALLAAGVNPKETKEFVTTLEWLAKTPDTMTYCLGLRCNVWHLASEMDPGGNWKAPLVKDFKQIIAYTQAGGYSYAITNPGWSDNSNSQYGVLGAWGAKLANIEVPDQYWRLVTKHWTDCQNTDGGWGYRKDNSTATMTVGGIASMFVCVDSLFADKFVACNTSTANNPIIKSTSNGLDWMDKNFQASLGGGGLMGHGDLYYYLYGVERVGLACGYKYFGTQDWFKMGALQLMRTQGGDGSWSGKFGPVCSTAWALIFLVRGQHAIAFNKLQHDGDWNNRPRDMAGLTRWMSPSMERTVNWQIINMKVPVEEWHDAPIVYLAGSQDPNFSDEQIGKLRTFVWQGGAILSVSECAGKGFGEGMRKAYAKLFPDYPLRAVPRDHPLYVVQHKLPLGTPAMFAIDNGIRPLAIHTDVDLSKAWQLHMKKTEEKAFQAATNIVMYVTDMGQLHARGTSPWPPKVEGEDPVAKIVRIRYKGPWDPEPLAYERFARLLAAETKVKLEMADPNEMGQINSGDAKIAVMTGTDAFTTTEADRREMKKFLDTGGTLILDAAGGSQAFGDSAEVLLRAMYGRDAIKRLTPAASVYAIPNFKLESAKYRRQARVSLGRIKVPNLRGVMIGQRIAVLFSREDVTGGLVGCPCYNAIGYEPASAYEVMRNCILYAAAIKPKGESTKSADAGG